MITWWNGTIVINTFFALRTVSFMLTFFRNASVARTGIGTKFTILTILTVCAIMQFWNTDIVHTMIFIFAVVIVFTIVFTSLDTFVIDALILNTTIKIVLTWSSWISNISIDYCLQQSLFISVKLCQIEKINHTDDYLVELSES